MLNHLAKPIILLSSSKHSIEPTFSTWTILPRKLSRLFKIMVTDSTLVGTSSSKETDTRSMSDKFRSGCRLDATATTTKHWTGTLNTGVWGCLQLFIRRLFNAVSSSLFLKLIICCSRTPHDKQKIYCKIGESIFDLLPLHAFDAQFVVVANKTAVIVTFVANQKLPQWGMRRQVNQTFLPHGAFLCDLCGEADRGKAVVNHEPYFLPV